MISLTEEFDACWEIFHLRFPDLQKPKLRIRSLCKAWGICKGKTFITLNSNLENAKVDFVRHVIFHEMCHLVYHHHKREFYDLLKQFDPLQQKEDSKKQKRLDDLKKLMDETATR